MASFINTNLSSLQAQRSLSNAQNAMNTSVQRLSSGLRVNGAKDDAAGLAIASGMDKTMRGQSVAMRNANDAISFSQTAEGALGQISDTLQRMRELAVQSANGTNSTEQRTMMNSEFGELQKEITRVVGNTEFNGMKVLGADAEQKFQIGSGTATATNQIEIKGTKMDTTGDTFTAVQSTVKIDGADATNALDAMTKIDAALKEVNTARTTHGAAQNRMSTVISTLQVSNENQAAARSRIMDTDFAAETGNMARNQILQQASTAMLAQANQAPNGVMKLLG